MKVLFISSWYPTPDNPNHGIFVKEHALALKEANNDVRVMAIVVRRDVPYWRLTHREYIDESGIRTFEIIIHSRIRDVFHHLVPLQQFIAYYYYRKNIRPFFSPELIHSNVVFPAGMIGDYIARKLQLPHVITEHWSKLTSFLKKPWLGKKALNVYKRAALILPVSDFLKSNMQRLMPVLPDTSFAIVPNVISSELFRFEPKKTQSDTIRFCAVATWAAKKEPDKYPELFIDALGHLREKISRKIHLTMVGGGNQLLFLKQKCLDAGIDAEFTGPLTKQQIASVLTETDYFLHASRIETFGVVVVEALMTGTPVVCSNVGGLPELIDDTTGILCENNVQAWIDAINRAVNTDYNHESIARYVQEKYTYKSIGNAINDAYQKVQK